MGQQHRLLVRVPGPLHAVLVPRELRRRADDHRMPGQFDPAHGIVVGHDLHEPVLLDGVDAHGGHPGRQQPEPERQVVASVAGEVAVVGLENGTSATVPALPAVADPLGGPPIRRLGPVVVTRVRGDLGAHDGDRVHLVDVVAGDGDALHGLRVRLVEVVGGGGGGRQIRPELGGAGRRRGRPSGPQRAGVAAGHRGREQQGDGGGGAGGTGGTRGATGWHCSPAGRGCGTRTPYS